MLIKILIALAVIVVVFVVIVALQPSEFKVVRNGHHLRAGPGAICAGERFSQMGSMEPVGETRSDHETSLRGRAGRNRRHLHLVR